MGSEGEIGRTFMEQSARHIIEDFLPKIEAAVGELTDEEIWWRPNARSNSIGNMLLHLSGNVRQWIVAGVGETPDTRRRQQEFDEQGPVPAAELMRRLRLTVDEAVAVFDALPPSRLLEMRHIQIYDVTVLHAIIHVVEHFSYHTGQIVYAAKLLKGKDFRFYNL